MTTTPELSFTSWTHQQCERCWFDRNTKHDLERDETMVRMPVQVVTPGEPVSLSMCCFCGKPCVTKIFVRADPVSVEDGCPGHERD